MRRALRLLRLRSTAAQRGAVGAGPARRVPDPPEVEHRSGAPALDALGHLRTEALVEAEADPVQLVRRQRRGQLPQQRPEPTRISRVWASSRPNTGVYGHAMGRIGVRIVERERRFGGDGGYTTPAFGTAPYKIYILRLGLFLAAAILPPDGARWRGWLGRGGVGWSGRLDRRRRRLRSSAARRRRLWSSAVRRRGRRPDSTPRRA